MDTEIEKKWTNSELQRLFRMEIKSRHTLMLAEEKGDIPKAFREQRGTIRARLWSIDQLPVIGEKFGFLKKPRKQVVLCVYTPKGGVLKTATTANIARMLALHGIRTLAIPLDFQKSLTNFLYPVPKFDTVNEIQEYIRKERNIGLFHHFNADLPIKTVIKKTAIPTLDIIPETPDLIALEKFLRSENRREYVFLDLINDQLQDYDVIILDNAPSWSMLTECSLTCANNVVSPLGCDFETLQALGENFIHIQNFKKKMKLSWDNNIIIPTLLEKNNVSQDVYEVYQREFGDMLLRFPIRRTVKGQEARIYNMSAIEYDPMSDLASDYFDMMKALWAKVLSGPSQS